MVWNLTEADAYIRLNTLDNEDYIDAEAERQTALLNVASTTLTRKYNAYTIPNEAVYIFATVLGAAFNDTNKLAKQGVSSFNVKGISFSFKNATSKDLASLIPAESVALIGEANDVTLSTGRSVKWTVM